MKNSSISLLAIMIAAAACDLETVPTDRYTVDSFWDTESGAEAAMSGCYNALTGSWLFGDAAPLLEETCTPNAYNYNNTGSWNTLAIGAHTSATEGVIKGRWSDAYRGIGRVNTQLNRLPGAAVSDERKRTMEGEAKFLRALFYYMLVQYYNGVPLILDEPAYSQAALPRDDRQTVVNAILSDLEDAARLLDWQWASANDQGRATRGAALALKARLLLFEASPLMNPSHFQCGVFKGPEYAVQQLHGVLHPVSEQRAPAGSGQRVSDGGRKPPHGQQIQRTRSALLCQYLLSGLHIPGSGQRKRCDGVLFYRVRLQKNEHL